MGGWIDTLIPLALGLPMIAGPRWFVKKTDDTAADAAKVAKVRTIGFVLTGVAALYAMLRLARGQP